LNNGDSPSDPRSGVVSSSKTALIARTTRAKYAEFQGTVDGAASVITSGVPSIERLYGTYC